MIEDAHDLSLSSYYRFILYRSFFSDDEYTKIMFSLQSGIRIAIVPATALMKTSGHPKSDPLADHSLHEAYVTSQHK